MVHQLKMWNGETHPVSDEWHRRYIKPFDGIDKLDFAQVDWHRRSLMAISNSRAEMGVHPTLTDHERALLSACDAFINANRCLRMLQNVDYKQWGLETIDQVHFNSKGFACGCVCHVVFDHHKANWRQEPHDHYAHRPLKTCPDHAHLGNDWQAHHDQVVADHSGPAEISGDPQE